jgi:hypothetical protein
MISLSPDKAASNNKADHFSEMSLFQRYHAIFIEVMFAAASITIH